MSNLYQGLCFLAVLLLAGFFVLRIFEKRSVSSNVQSARGDPAIVDPALKEICQSIFVKYLQSLKAWHLGEDSDAFLLEVEKCAPQMEVIPASANQFRLGVLVAVNFYSNKYGKGNVSYTEYVPLQRCIEEYVRRNVKDDSFVDNAA